MEKLDVASAALEFIDLGFIGAFLTIVIAFLIAVWLNSNKKDAYIIEMNKSMVEIITKLTIVVEDTFIIVKELPKEVRDRMKPDLDSMNKTLDQINSKIK
jgi:hypothetical protein